jgi:small conductance mechanosensitive channel
MHELIRILANLLLAAFIPVAGFCLAKIVSRFARKVFGRLSHGSLITTCSDRLYILPVLGVTLFIALRVLRLYKALTSLLADAGIAGFALAFAFQDIAANFVSGILLYFRRPLRVGDIAKVKDYMGKVQAINLRDTD